MGVFVLTVFGVVFLALLRNQNQRDTETAESTK